MTESLFSFTDEQLAAQFQNGDDHAFTMLAERMIPVIRYEVSFFHCSEADRDDLTQEAFRALLSAAVHFRIDGGASFATFARVCIKNRLQTAVKKASLPEVPHEADEIFEKIDQDASSVMDPDEWLLNKEEEKAFTERLERLLSPLELRVLRLHLSSYSYKEIAELLDLTEKAVDNALQRVRRKLSA